MTTTERRLDTADLTERVDPGSIDCVISNGVVNLSPDKPAVFAAAGFEIAEVRENEQYRFISDRADNATQKYGVTSISLLARRS